MPRSLIVLAPGHAESLYTKIRVSGVFRIVFVPIQTVGCFKELNLGLQHDHQHGKQQEGQH
jgi:hypothetical protein